MLTTREILEGALAYRHMTKQECATRVGRTKQAFGRTILNDNARMSEMLELLGILDVDMRMFDRTDGAQITPGTPKEMYLEIIGKRKIPNTEAGRLVDISGQAWRDQILLRQTVKGSIYLRLMDKLGIDVKFFDRKTGEELNFVPVLP